MSCPPEWTVGAYVDQGLAAAEARRVEAHLVGCERCRALVLALREEARALGEALAGEGAREPGSVSAAVPARAAAWGLPIAIAATALVTAVASALYEMRLPMVFLRPSSLLGVNDMLFDTLFLLRDRATGLYELAIALGALGGMAAIATFLAGALLRRYARVAAWLLLAGAAGLAGGRAHAAPRFASEETVRVAAGETHTGTLAVSCESLVVEGIVVGDVWAFCERVSIRGEVDGSVVALGRELEVTGEVTGGLVSANHQVRLEGGVGRSAYLAAERVSIGPRARVARDAFLLGGERVHVEGEVARDLTAGGERIELEGEVGRDLEAWSERVAVLAGARVGGDLRAHLPEREALEVAPGAVVAGTTDFEVLDRHRHTIWARYRDGRFYAWLALGFAASFLIGMLLHTLAPRLFAGRLVTGRDFFVSLGLGFAVLVLAPIALLLLALTVVGIPAALIGLAAWGVTLYLGGVVVAALIGRSLVKPRGDGARDFGVALLVGLAVVVVVKSLPFVGRPAGWVIALVGVGLLAAQAHAAWQRSRGAARA
jgi:cytoskeletal protein CcmA (bactofilin family)